MTRLVSIVVPTRGGATRLPRLFASLAAQTDPDFEVIVVVDGDIDDTQALLTQPHGFGLTPIVFAENRGRASALNAGFAAARGAILVRADDDLELPVDFVSYQRQWHATHDGGLIGQCRNVYPPTAYADVYGLPMDRIGRAAAYATAAESTWRHWGANVSVNRATYDKVGPYDVDYRGYGWEDVDWGWRLHQAGYEIQVRPEIEALHYVAATTTAIRARRSYASGSARNTFIAKHGDTMLPTLAPATGAWNRLVHATAARLTSDRLDAWAAQVDRSLPHLPPAIGRKAVALLVEAAHHAGYGSTRGTTISTSPNKGM